MNRHAPTKIPVDLLDPTDHLTALVRAYVPVPAVKQTGTKRRKPAPPSDWVLVFDTETTNDAALALRIGAFQLRKSGKIVEHGLFYEPAALTSKEVQLLTKYTASRNLSLLTRSQFVDDFLYAKAYAWRATIVGFNLPFDLSRLAIRHNSARGRMKGGFTFQLSENPWHARIQVRHHNARAAFIRFAAERRQLTSRGASKRGLKTPARRGSFVDIKTLSAALLGRAFSLESLTAFLETPTHKRASDDHGQALTSEYLDYAASDVQATWECFERLSCKFEEHGLLDKHPGEIVSEASIGKAMFRQMGLRSFREMQPDFPAVLQGQIMSTYFGGRSEVHFRRTIKQVFYCDFLSMYPTVCTLMNLWRFITAQGVEWRETAEETQDFLNGITLNDLRSKDVWPSLATIVQLRPNADALPLRAKYDGTSATIGLNLVTSDEPLWYTLADLVASKLLTGRAPIIDRAISFTPMAPQQGLKPVVIGVLTIDPIQDDLFKRLIEQRMDIKARRRNAQGFERTILDAEQQALKLVANATGYGIYVEVNVSEREREEERSCYGPSGSGFGVRTNKAEEPGSFFNPLVATLIAGAARLMLASAESLTKSVGLDWAFCDTDSLAIAKPDEMSFAEFLCKARQVTDWFDALNPYARPAALFKVEDVNYEVGRSEAIEPLHALCISAKRYVLFNLDDTGQPVVRKASAHGLGHLMAPYRPDEAPKCIPTPVASLESIGVERWQYDLWYQIICAAINDHPDEVDRSYHPALNLPAVSRYGATKPSILRWFDSYNEERPYADQVKPFNFLASLQLAPFACVNSEGADSRRRRRHALKPVAPYSKDPREAAANAFDRNTGVAVPPEALRTYASVLAQFHLSPEAKFQNGNYLDRGKTERRHVHVTGMHHIGKEANLWEEQYHLGFDEEAQIEYRAPLSDDQNIRLRLLVDRLGERKASDHLHVSKMTLRKALRSGTENMSLRVQRKLGII